MIDITKLQESDKKLVLELIPKKEIFEFIKRNSKYFNKELMGIRLDKKSKLLQQKIPEIMLKQFVKEDIIAINFISNRLKTQLYEINKYVEEHLEKDILSILPDNKEKLKSKLPINFKLYIKSIIETKEEKNYIKLLNILLEKIEADYIMLYITLNEIELKPRQRKLLETSLLGALKYNEIKERIYEEERKKIDEKINLAIESEQLLLRNEKSLNQELKDKLRDKDASIKEQQKIIDDKVKEIEIEKETNNDLRKKLQKLKLENTNIIKKIELIEKNYEEILQVETNISNELEETIKEKERLIKKLNQDLEERYETYSYNYSLKWQEENNEKLIEEKKVSEKINSMKSTIELLSKEITDLELEKDHVKNKLDKYNNIVNDFINNIDEELIKNVLRNSISDIKINKKLSEPNDTSLYIKTQTKDNQNEIKVGEDIDEFIDLLSDNLKNLGVREDRENLANYIAGVLVAKMIPLITGYKTREIAKAISYSYSGESPFIISLPAGYSNISELIDIYNNCEAKVILIEGIIGQMNESIMIPLFKEYMESKNDEKILLISSEDTEMVKLIPVYLFEYIALINILKMKPMMKYDYISGDNIENLQYLREEDLDLNSSYKQLNKLFKGIDFNKSYLMSRVLILSYLYKFMEYGQALECLIKSEIKFVSKDNDIQDEIINNIQNHINDFSLDVKELIEGV